MSRFYTHDALNDPIRNVKSSGALLSELDLFSGPATQTEIEGCYWERVHCLEAGLDPTQKEVILIANLLWMWFRYSTAIWRLSVESRK